MFEGVPKGTTTLVQSNNVTNPAVNAANNRFSAGQGYSYDLAGNVTQDAAGMQFVYDAENRQKEARDSGGFVVGQYFYDGEGRRVKKVSATETVVFVYDGGGVLVAEYSTVGSPTASVKYLTQDHLGSPRVVMDQNGAVVSRTDFGAFGEETVTSQRTVGLGYKADNVRQDYTGYEKDDESGLEYAQARYYNPAHGRFTSVDPLAASASLADPQTFNRYSYGLNSPYKFTDPLGLMACQGPGAGNGAGASCDGADANGNPTQARSVTGTTPQFRPFSQLSADEQRILNNSKITVEVKENGKKVKKSLIGEELCNNLANSSNKKGNKQLANFLNQTAVLSDTRFSNGRTAISYVNSVIEFRQDKIIAQVDPALKNEIEKLASNDPKDKARFQGPENSSLYHGIYGVSFRENGFDEGPQQLSFASSLEFKQADIDIDPCKKGRACHAGDVIKNTLFRSKTNPYEMYELLVKRNIRPNYNIPK